MRSYTGSKSNYRNHAAQYLLCTYPTWDTKPFLFMVIVAMTLLVLDNTGIAHSIRQPT